MGMGETGEKSKQTNNSPRRAGTSLDGSYSAYPFTNKELTSMPQPTCTQALIKTACCFTLPRVVYWQAFRVQTDKRTLHLEPKPGKSSGLRPPRTYPSTPESRPQQPDKGSSSASSRLSVDAHQSLVSTNGTDVFICQSDPHQKLQPKRRGPYTVILSTPTAVTVQGLPHWVHCTRVKLTPKGTPSSKTLTVGNTLRVLVYNNLNKEKRSLKLTARQSRRCCCYNYTMDTNLSLKNTPKIKFFFFQGPVPRRKATCASSMRQQDSRSRKKAGGKTPTPEDRERGHLRTM
ncbi:uncharacterized protein LOC129041539 [Pongo pygmaeus]|uniref:uncharacterized protein LOC129041539 n=1 Tax=Pongo pygmaeus TaxID=9600 RepID=UPI0023E1425A|nr:uncharacterized protein LOC129041539 [Pongo pygmaeus]